MLFEVFSDCNRLCHTIGRDTGSVCCQSSLAALTFTCGGAAQEICLVKCLMWIVIHRILLLTEAARGKFELTQCLIEFTQQDTALSIFVFQLQLEVLP